MLPRRLFCLTALALLVACARSTPTAPAASTNVLLVTLDTTRADRLGRGFTPHVDRIAARGLRFTEARTVEPLTNPALCSMFTSLYPHEHGATRNGLRLRPDLPSAARVLMRRGTARTRLRHEGRGRSLRARSALRSRRGVR